MGSGQLLRSLKKEGVNLEHAHVSGHAPAENLAAFASQANARETITIHTSSPGYLADRLTSHQQRRDGEWWSVESETGKVEAEARE